MIFKLFSRFMKKSEPEQPAAPAAVPTVEETTPTELLSAPTAVVTPEPTPAVETPAAEQRPEQAAPAPSMIEATQSVVEAAPEIPTPTPAAPPAPAVAEPASASESEDASERRGFFERMKLAVTRTRQSLGERIEAAISFHAKIDKAALDDLEATLLSADLGSPTTTQVLKALRERAEANQIADATALKAALKEELLKILRAAERPEAARQTGEPLVILVVGVNGTGKTTTIGKLSHLLSTNGYKVLLCAADTFRAAAIEQLEVWSKRTGCELIKSAPGGDPAAVLFDALSAAKARNCDCVIVDTAGRLHNKAGLMAELDKMRRTAQRVIPGAPHETLLVMDATTGQNGLQQARQFTESSGVTGIVLSKLDGTAKGGVVVAIAREMSIPVRYVGTGEQIGDLLLFDAEDFVDSLFD